MRIEPKFELDENRNRVLQGVAFIAEYTGESLLLDKLFGRDVGEDGLIGVREAECLLSDELAKHYVYIKA